MTRRRLASEAGFTLVELMVTMVAGVVVLLALGTIMDVTLRETTRSFTLVDATERARPIFEADREPAALRRASPTKRRRSKWAAARTR